MRDPETTTNGEPWTDFEDMIITSIYPVQGNKGVALVLTERSLDAIRKRASKLLVVRNFTAVNRADEAQVKPEADPARDLEIARLEVEKAEVQYRAAASVVARAHKTFAKPMTERNRDRNHQRRVS